MITLQYIKQDSGPDHILAVNDAGVVVGFLEVHQSTTGAFPEFCDCRYAPSATRFFLPSILKPVEDWGGKLLAIRRGYGLEVVDEDGWIKCVCDHT